MRNALRNLVPFVLVAMCVGAIVVDGGDTPRDFWAAGISAGIGLLAWVVHTRFERNRERAARIPLSAWTVIRFFLAFEFTRYGAAKVVGMQFYKRYSQLDSRVVDLEPARLAWSFFGRSYGYQAISGWIEILAAVLLCFRRTTTLGACVLLTVISNIVLLDFHYDVPVRLTSSTFLVMTLYLLSFDANRFRVFFFGDDPVPPRDYLAATLDRRLVAPRVLFIALVLGYPAGDIVHKAFQYRLLTPDILEGAWSINRMDGLDDLLPGSKQWNKVYFEKGDYGFVRVGKQLYRFTSTVNEGERKLHVAMFGRESRSLDATFELDDPRVRIEGVSAGKPFSLELTRDPSVR